MIRIVRRCFTVGLLSAFVGQLAAADRPASQILRDLDAVKMPALDPARQSDPAYIDQMRKAFVDAGGRRDVLILELFQAHPDHEQLPQLMREHWRRMPPIGPSSEKLQREITEVLARTGNEDLKAEAFFARAQTDLFRTQQTGRPELAGVEEFVRRYPKDFRSEVLLYSASQVVPDPRLRRTLEGRVLTQYPKSRFAPAILGTRRQAESIGRDFELEFTDAISRARVSSKDLRGKVVVVDFWATWCPPCLAELPHLKALRAKHHPRLEVIGVSLDLPPDQGGLESLRSFVKEKQIPWPQYYLGQSWESEFAVGWGINSLPTVFVVDVEGKLAAVLATDNLAQLDQVVSDLLAARGRPADRTPARGD